MPARRGQNSRTPAPPPEKAVLKIPLPRAQQELQARIDAGQELASTTVPSLEGDPHAGIVVFGPPSAAWVPTTKPVYPELDALRQRVSQWTDYNQTWLRRNLGGEAAEEYESASNHIGFGEDDPRIRLRYLREDIGTEVSKLESIRDRLALWAPEDTTSDSSASTGHSPVALTGAQSADPAEAATDFAINRKAVMVIFGHDKEANDAMFDWLRAIGLQPREWTQLVQTTGSGSPYIGQVLDHAFRQAQAVVALFTPDEYVTASAATPDGWRLQARPNVLIEAGMALATHPTRTVLVMLGNQEIPSDLAGRHYVRLSHTETEPLHDLASRLHAAGCDTDTTGAHWLNPSRFPDRKRPSQPPHQHPAANVEQASQPTGQAASETPAQQEERRAREDADARQVTVNIEQCELEGPAYDNATHLITVSTPRTYPIKQVDGQIAWQTNNGGLGMTGLGYAGDPPRADGSRIIYTFRASVSPQIRNPEPILRFVDQHGSRYYQFRLHTQRFPGNTDWTKAADAIDLWLRTGPNPD